MPGEDYGRLSLSVRRFLETASDQEVVELANAIRWYGDLHDRTKHYLLGTDADKQPVILSEKGRQAIYDMLELHQRITPEARQFLVASDESVFKWLISLRQEEVDLIRMNTKLRLAFQTVGQFGKWALGGLILAIIMSVQFGAAFKGLFSGWFGGGK